MLLFRSSPQSLFGAEEICLSQVDYAELSVLLALEGLEKAEHGQ